MSLTPFLALGMPHGLDWLWIVLIFFLIFGPKKLPELARGLGRSLGEFKKAKDDFNRELQAGMQEPPHPPTTPTVPPVSQIPSAPLPPREEPPRQA